MFRLLHKRMRAVVVADSGISASSMCVGPLGVWPHAASAYSAGTNKCDAYVDIDVPKSCKAVGEGQSHNVTTLAQSLAMCCPCCPTACPLNDHTPDH